MGSHGQQTLRQVRQLRQKSFLLATPQGTQKNQQSDSSNNEEIVQAVQPHHPLSNSISNRRKISIISHLRSLLLRRLPTAEERPHRVLLRRRNRIIIGPRCRSSSIVHQPSERIRSQLQAKGEEGQEGLGRAGSTHPQSILLTG